VPGGWNNRFKNAWEPVFHFCRQPEIKFRPKAVGHVSEDCFDYSPNNPKSTSGSGLLGTGARGSAASESGANDDDGRFTGIARPSNVVEVKSEAAKAHTRPFLALVIFVSVLRPGDVVSILSSAAYDRAAQVLSGRYGTRSPGVLRCDPAPHGQPRRREPVLAETGDQMAAVAAARGVPDEQVDNPRLRDARRIQHHGPAPFYGSRKAS
jgi:hypothetical protein